ncbi:MAG: glycine--tRNA ligase [Rickettsiales bacterium]|jgi:glycyl-tRNA synthetase|nr:glycine--tRNA ligase [Rickettsiales bacterium]
MAAKSMDELVSLCKRRGFIFQNSEIYGGIKGVYDYGPLGIELKKNIMNAWWSSLVYERDDIEGIEGAILSNPLIWKYSGHEDTFGDLLVECKKCHLRMRADHVKDGKCDSCGSTDLTQPRMFNVMMKTNVGFDEDSFSYLRPETAQSTYVNFKNVLDSVAQKIPFGIAQYGKSFRNEITPRNFLFRTREFEQAEMQFFVEPGTDEKWYEQWQEFRINWWIKNGLNIDNLRFVPHEKLAHYAKAAGDIEYKFPHGFDELEGIHNRQDFDLGSHSKAQKEFDIKADVKENKDSNSKLNYLDPISGKSYIPYVVETAMGIGRAVIAFLNEAYTEEQLEDGKSRIVLKFAKHLSPVKVAVIPLAKNNEEIVGKARKIKNDLQKLAVGRVMFENSGNIGKAYRRHDEVGTPICITVDFETLEKGTVTIRDRDSMKQIRVEIEKLEKFITDFFKD